MPTSARLAHDADTGAIWSRFSQYTPLVGRRAPLSHLEHTKREVTDASDDAAAQPPVVGRPRVEPCGPPYAQVPGHRDSEKKNPDRYSHATQRICRSAAATADEKSTALGASAVRLSSAAEAELGGPIERRHLSTPRYAEPVDPLVRDHDAEIDCRSDGNARSRPRERLTPTASRAEEDMDESSREDESRQRHPDDQAPIGQLSEERDAKCYDRNPDRPSREGSHNTKSPGGAFRQTTRFDRDAEQRIANDLAAAKASGLGRYILGSAA